jgi:hypothetical protein
MAKEREGNVLLFRKMREPVSHILKPPPEMSRSLAQLTVRPSQSRAPAMPENTFNHLLLIVTKSSAWAPLSAHPI